jgi:hypothetical protein
MIIIPNPICIDLNQVGDFKADIIWNSMTISKISFSLGKNFFLIDHVFVK